jgi:demethylmenaquinone methyltransferase/2-methoxy-6-polyprenyl-1,4-benzoquinol methylase
MGRYYPFVRLADEIATPEGKRRYVRTLFATIADRYDAITVILSYGQDRRWKRRLIDLADPRRGQRVLDLATGTGDIAFALASRGADVVGLDVTQRMIELAEAKNDASRGVRFLVGDMLALPFPRASFDAVTVGYGLRNVPDLGAALDEVSRVLKPGGRLLSLDFNRPANRTIRWTYMTYLRMFGSALGWVLHRDPDTYRYIPASLMTYPGAAGVERMLGARGFSRVRHYPILGGLMSIHRAFRDSDH